MEVSQKDWLNFILSHECAVCFEDLEHPVELRPCKHIFCKKCICSYNKKAPKECPMCRKKYKSKSNAGVEFMLNAFKEFKRKVEPTDE